MDSIHDLWALVMEELKKDVPYIALQTWFDDIKVVGLQEGVLTLCSPITFKRETIEKYYLDRLRKVLRSILSETVEVKLLSPEEYQSHLHEGNSGPRSLREAGEYTFERFIVGPSNHLAYTAAQAVIAEHSRYTNPLVIYGRPGLGKTHLLNAIASAVAKSKPDAAVVCVKGEDFTNELIQSIKQNRQAEFRRKYRCAEYLLMDDIQFIAGKLQTQEEFFNVFDRLYEGNCQIVITLDRPFCELSTLQDRIRNRFEGGLVAEIEAPDFEMRCAIIRTKAEQRSLVLAETEIKIIAQQITGDSRKLEGVLNKLKALRSMQGYTFNGDDVAIALQEYHLKNEDTALPEEVIEVVATQLHVDVAAILGRSRSRTVTRARQVAMYLLCEVYGQSTVSVGRFFERDHSTVVHAVEKTRELIRNDSAINALVKGTSKQLCPK